jgi:biotin carboxylase
MFEQIDLRDKEGTLKFAKKNKVEGIFTNADIGVPTAAYIAKKLELKYHSEILADQATNKYLMRKRAEELGLIIPRYLLIKSTFDLEKIEKEFTMPIILKPVDNCGSRGVLYVNDFRNVLSAYQYSFKKSFTGNVIVEEFISGKEGSIEVLMENFNPTILGFCSKIKSPFPYRFDIRLDYPGDYSEGEIDEINSFTKKLVKGFNISNGIIHIEFIIRREKIYLVEFAIRGCGGNVISHLLPATTGFDIPQFLIKQVFGTNDDIYLNRKGLHGTLLFLMFPKGKIKKISGLEEIRNLEYVADISIQTKVGDNIDEMVDSSCRPGHLIVTGISRTDINEKIKTCLNLLKIEYY